MLLEKNNPVPCLLTSYRHSLSKWKPETLASSELRLWLIFDMHRVHLSNQLLKCWKTYLYWKHLSIAEKEQGTSQAYQSSWKSMLCFRMYFSNNSEIWFSVYNFKKRNSPPSYNNTKAWSTKESWVLLTTDFAPLPAPTPTCFQKHYLFF